VKLDAPAQGLLDVLPDELLMLCCSFAADVDGFQTLAALDSVCHRLHLLLPHLSLQLSLYCTSDRVLSGLGGAVPLKKLHTLHLIGSHRITPAGLRSLCAFRDLTDLNLRFCSGIGDLDLQTLTCLPGLTALDVSYCNLNGSFLQGLSNLHGLRRLSLCENGEVGNESLELLSGFRALEEVNLSGCGSFSVNTLELLAVQLTALHTLDLSRCVFSLTGGADSVVRPLSVFTTLTSLNLSSTLPDGIFLSLFAGSTNLHRLDLSDCCYLEDEHAHWLCSLTALIALNLTGTFLKESFLRSLSGLRAVQQLSLAENDLVDDACLQRLSVLSTLRDLDISQCGSITFSGLTWLATGLQKLQKLDVSSSWVLDDYDLLALSGFNALTELNLSHNLCFNGTGLQSLSGSVTLKTLILSGCVGLLAPCLQWLDPIVSLRVLDTTNCDGLGT
jgi:hypothetical protein